MKKSGFTLIEIMAAIAIIAILALLVLPNFIGTYNNSVEKAMITQEHETVDGVKLFVEDYCRNPLPENKGLCNTYSLNVNSSTPTKKYTCLNTLQSLDYMEDIVINGISCRGFITYTKENNSREYKDYKAYLDCGSVYQTSGYDSFKDDSNNPIINNCGSVLLVGDESDTVVDQMLDNYLMEGSNSDKNSNYLRTNIKKDNIETITFTNSIVGHTANNSDTFDVSVSKNGSVLAWVSDSDSNGKYEITIGQEGGVKASTGQYLFCNLENLTTINGMEYFDTSYVKNMYRMFSQCLKLANIDLSHFDTSNVTNMRSMFSSCISLTTLDLSNFNTSKVTTMYMMFGSDGISNPSKEMHLRTIIGIENLDVSKVVDFQAMFQTCVDLTSLNLSRWNTSSATNMYGMFLGCYSMTSLNLSGWNTSKVTNMKYMFYKCKNLTSLNLSSFNTSKVTDMSYMFASCSKLSNISSISSFNTSNVTNMSCMFANCLILSDISSISNFNTSKVTNMAEMFFNCKRLSNFNALTNWDTSNVENMKFMFGMNAYEERENSPVIDFNFLKNWNVSKVKTLYATFQNNNIKSYEPFANWNVSKVENFEDTFNQSVYSVTTSLHGLENWDTSSATNMVGMFRDNISVTDFSAIKNWNTSKVTDMSYMFRSCQSAVTIDISGFDTSNVTLMDEMFSYNAELKTIYVDSRFKTNSVTSSIDMFKNSTRLVGGAGTVYNSSKVDKSYAHIDGGTSNPGYFTSK